MSEFAKVRCPKCKNEQTVFSKPSSVVGCVICGYTLVKPKGSKGNVRGRIVEVHE